MTGPEATVYPYRTGMELLAVYRRNGQLADLDAAVINLRTAHQAAAGTGMADSCATDLAGALLDRYDHDGSNSDLDRALDLLDDVVGRRDPPLAAITLLANALLSRYERGGCLADRDRALELQQSAGVVGSADRAQLGAALSNLGATLAESPDTADLDRAVELLRGQLADLLPTDPDYPKRINNLGNALLLRAERDRSETDLDEAVRCFRLAARAPGAVVGRHAWLSNLANAWCIRFSWNDDRIDDLDRAVAAFDEAVSECPPNSPDLAGCLSNLGNGLLDRYEISGQSGDLERAVSVMRAAVDRTPTRGVQRAARLSNLSSGLLDRYAAGGYLDDAEEAVALCREAVSVMVADSTDAPRWFTNLGNGLMALHERRHEAGTLAAAVDAYREAVERVDQHDADRPLYLSNLGTALAARNRPASLHHAIALFTDALRATPRRSPQRATWLNNIGNGYADLYDLTSDARYLRTAIARYRKALHRTPREAPEYADWSLNLALALANRWSTGRLPRRASVVDRAFRTCCRRARDTAPEIWLRAASGWARWSRNRGAWQRAASASEEALRAVHGLFAAQLLLRHRHTWLASAPDLFAEASYAHVRARDPRAAATALERGRALQLSEAFDLAHLERAANRAGPDLHGRFQRLVAEYRRLSTAPGRPALLTRTDAAEDRTRWRELTMAIANRRRLRTELGQVVAEIRGRTADPP